MCGQTGAGGGKGEPLQLSKRKSKEPSISAVIVRMDGETWEKAMGPWISAEIIGMNRGVDGILELAGGHNS